MVSAGMSAPMQPALCSLSPACGVFTSVGRYTRYLPTSPGLVMTSRTLAPELIGGVPFAAQVSPVLDHCPHPAAVQPRQATNDSYWLPCETLIPSPQSD